MINGWLDIAHLSFEYPSRPLFHDLCLSVSTEFRIVGILGPSGIGKSTLLGLIAGYQKPSHGTISVNGEIVTNPSAKRPVVFQDHNLFPWKSVYKNIELGLRAKKIPKAERKRRIIDLLNAMGMGSSAEMYPRELSGGMQQRVGLARAMAVSPTCILMDEPFSALDKATRNSVRKFFKHTLERNNTNAIIVTHNAEEAMELCDYLIVIRDAGKVSTIEKKVIDLNDLHEMLSYTIENKSAVGSI